VGHLFARPSAYVEEGKMTSGGMAPLRLPGVLNTSSMWVAHSQRWVEQEVDSEEKDKKKGKDDKELVKQQGWYWKPS